MNLKKWLLDLFFPLSCLNCSAPGAHLCPACFAKLKFRTRNYSRNLPALDQVFIAGDYDDSLIEKLIKHLKFSYLEPLGPILGRFLILFWKKFVLPQSSIMEFRAEAQKLLIIPIPLSKKSWRRRGFNQAELLARTFAEHFAYELSLDLKKTRDRRPQSSLSESERAKNIKGCFTWVGASLAGRSVLLVDDVITTGATLSEAALTLKQAGAEKILALALAKG